MSFSSPVVGIYQMWSHYGWREIYGEARRHEGIDISGGHAVSGAPIYAIADGKVTVIQTKNTTTGYGVYVEIDHEGEGLPGGARYSFYAHLLEGSITVEDGATVRKGQQIARLGSTGRSQGPHLHFELRLPNRSKIDPFSFLESTSIENLPGVLKTLRTFESNGQTIEVKRWTVKPVRFGIYSAEDENGQETNETPTEVVQIANQNPNASNAATIESNKAKEQEEEAARELIDNKDVRLSALSFYLPEIIENKKKYIFASRQAKDIYLPSNLLYIDGKDNTAALTNMVFSKSFSDFNTLTNLEMSNMVPYVEMYKVKKTANSNNFEEIIFPFDDYTIKEKVEAIFYDKTGRGGSIGIKSVDWKTLATNPSNRSQISANVKILIQDIQDLETRRNGISLLDFLYPISSTKKKDEFNHNNFTVKLKVGWRYKTNETLSNIEQKIRERELSETLYVSLYKHSFDFQDDGSIIIDLDYIGMIETEISDPNNTNILNKLNPEKARIETGINALKRLTGYLGFSSQEDIIKRIDADGEVKRFVSVEIPKDGFFALRERGYIPPEARTLKFKNTNIDIFDKITNALSGDNILEDYSFRQKKIEETKKIIEEEQEKLRKSYKIGLTNLLTFLVEQEKVKYLFLDNVRVDALKNISIFDRNFTQEKYSDFVIQLEKSRIDLTQIPSENAPRQPNEITNSFKNLDEKFFDDKNHIKADEFLKIFNDKIETKDSGETTITIAYTFLDHILGYFTELCLENNIDSKASDLIASNLRIGLGSFSYREIGDLSHETNAKGAGREDSTGTLVKDGYIFKKLKLAKKYASLGDIPISIESIINWYNTKILDADLTKMSFHQFLKNMVIDLISANLNNKILPFAPTRSIICSLNYITIPKNTKIDEELTNSYNQFKYYKINMDSANIQNKLLNKNNADTYITEFLHLKDKVDSNVKKEDKQNYLFIFSTNEYDENLKAEYNIDKDKSIFHFYIGEDRGLIKSIKFSKEDNAQLDAANVIKANNGDTNSQIMRKIYNLDLEMFGNTIFHPGQLLHVVPSYPGGRIMNKTLYQIGLGGYYIITEIKSFIESGMYKTSITGKWQMSGLGIEEDTNESDLEISYEIPLDSGE